MCQLLNLFLKDKHKRVPKKWIVSSAACSWNIKMASEQYVWPYAKQGFLTQSCFDVNKDVYVYFVSYEKDFDQSC